MLRRGHMSYNEHDYLLLHKYANVLRDCGAVFLALVEFHLFYDGLLICKYKPY